MNSSRRSPQALPALHTAREPRAMVVARRASTVLVAAVLMLASTAWFVYRGFESDLGGNALDISGLGAQSGARSTEGGDPPSDSFAGRALNVLLVGQDGRHGQGDSFGSETDIEGMRADTTMLVHVSADRSRIQVVSIPRDLKTDIPSCTRSDGSVSGATFDRFNAAFAIGSNSQEDVASGIACTRATVEHLSGLPVDEFAVVDFTGFEAMIEALGGVWLDVPEDVHDVEAQAFLSAGCQKLDGPSALGYARARKSLGDGTDLGRIGRQQTLVAAIFREALSKNYVTDLPAVLSFLKQTLASLQTSVGLSGLNADLGLLLSVADIDRASIQFVMMPNHYDPEEEGPVLASEPESSALWAALASDSGLPVGTAYTDGHGAAQVVPDPGAGTAPGSAQSGAAPDTATPSAPPGDGSTQPEAPVDSCPPSGGQ
ncbi:MAG: LCP family protein [Actinomyces sp.]|nr:LCP family protein [Actinomyces sp.]